IDGTSAIVNGHDPVHFHDASLGIHNDLRELNSADAMTADGEILGFEHISVVIGVAVRPMRDLDEVCFLHCLLEGQAVLGLPSRKDAASFEYDVLRLSLQG